MFFSKASFIALVAIGIKSAMAIPAAEVGVVTLRPAGATPDAAQVDLVQLCEDINFGGCVTVTFGSVPTGCVGIASDQYSSARAISGVSCTLFENAGCGGRSLRIAGDVPNFPSVGFNDIATSMSCVGA
ncbi:hypothetical protein C8J57DRAFT_725581 [Mycena rebaudengoi]|nr:hypothetical protein C8J57DRAFT_725581 [Mycena rebaudengoi]